MEENNTPKRKPKRKIRPARKEIREPTKLNQHTKEVKPILSDIEIARKMINILQSASDRKLKFDLSFNTVKELMSVEKCYYTDVPFEEEGVFSRSFDRIDSNLGYVEGNVVACTVDFNGKKSNLSLEEIEILYEKIVKPVRDLEKNEGRI